MESCVKYEPKFSRVLIKREVKKTTAGGIILPETTVKRHQPCRGEIVALGETAGWTDAHRDGELTPIQTLKVGDKVIFGRHSGAWLDGETEDDGTLFICQDEDILVVIKE